MSFEIVLLALVAGFLGLRLYSVLGKRTGHEQEPVPGQVEQARSAAPAAPRLVSDRSKDAAPEPASFADSGAQRGLQAIVAADRSFDTLRFLDGAKRAYGMVLDAFWRADREELAYLTDESVLAEFEAAIAAREEAGETLENRLIRIEDVRIVSAEMAGSIARITIQFDADVSSIIRDRDGVIIGGSTTDAVESHDIWTFARDTRAPDPDWKLVETDVA